MDGLPPSSECAVGQRRGKPFRVSHHRGAHGVSDFNARLSLRPSVYACVKFPLTPRSKYYRLGDRSTVCLNRFFYRSHTDGTKNKSSTDSVLISYNRSSHARFFCPPKVNTVLV